MTELTRRKLIAAGALGLATLGLAACGPVTTPAPLPLPSRAAAHTKPYVSGVSCIGAADGAFGRWRGSSAPLAGTWAKDGRIWVLNPGGEYAAWTGDLDFAPQYKFDDSFSWRALAGGEYDKVLTADFDHLKSAWAKRPGTLYYRFQHEFNAHWYPWGISDADIDDFVDGWRRFAAIFRNVFGYDERFRIVWSPNAGSQARHITRTVDAYPGSLYVDVIGIDYYDFFATSTPEEWTDSLTATEKDGGPMGIESWRQFAEDEGRPLAVSEWGQQYGDNPVFIQGMHEYIDLWRHTGQGSAAGRIVYDCYFNQRLKDDASPDTDGDFILTEDGTDYPGRPVAAQRYRELWTSWPPALTTGS